MYQIRTKLGFLKRAEVICVNMCQGLCTHLCSILTYVTKPFMNKCVNI